MITATFSLVQQLVHMKVLPPYVVAVRVSASIQLIPSRRFRMKHTSEVIRGQVFIPAINWTRKTYSALHIRPALSFLVAFQFSYGCDYHYGSSIQRLIATDGRIWVHHRSIIIFRRHID